MEQQEKISMEDIDKIEKIFNVEYSDTVKYAVRLWLQLSNRGRAEA